MIKQVDINRFVFTIVFFVISTHMQLYGQHPPQSSESIDDVALAGNLAEVQRIVAMDHKVVNRKLVLNSTPLHLASMKGHLPVVRFLVGCGADIHARDFEGMTPLFRAGKAGHVAVVKFLMKHGANLNTTDQHGQTLLHHLSTKKNKLPMLKFLIKNGSMVNCKNHKGETPLYGAVYQNNLDVVKLLIENGAVVDTPNWTPLHIAVNNKCLEIAQCLLAHGASIEAETSWGKKVLPLALGSEYFQIAKCLIERYATIGELETEVNNLFPGLLTRRRDRLAMVLKNTPLPIDLQQLLIKFVIDK